MAKSTTARPWDGRPMIEVRIAHVPSRPRRPRFNWGAQPRWQRAVQLDDDSAFLLCVPLARLERAWRAVPRDACWEWSPTYLLITWDTGARRGRLKLCTAVMTKVNSRACAVECAA